MAREIAMFKWCSIIVKSILLRSVRTLAVLDSIKSPFKCHNIHDIKVTNFYCNLSLKRLSIFCSKLDRLPEISSETLQLTFKTSSVDISSILID